MKALRSTKQFPRVGTALLLIDVINSFDFDGADNLLRNALPMARKLRVVRGRFKRNGLPVIYANDNFGQWRSDFPTLFEYIATRTKGAEIAQLLAPDDDDYFVLKPKHSAFYMTPLELLLDSLCVSDIVIGGVQTDMCVLLTAHDAYMRDFRLRVPEDCSACESMRDHTRTIAHIERVLKANTSPSGSLRLRH